MDAGVTDDLDGLAATERSVGSLDAQPDVVRAYSDVLRNGDVEGVVRALDVVWAAVERGALWVSRIQVDWNSATPSLAASTSNLMLPVLASHLRAVSVLGRAGLDHLPTALSAARAGFEIGVRVAWIHAGSSDDEIEIRAVALHGDSSTWKAKVASRLDEASIDGERWREAAAERQARIVNRVMSGHPPGSHLPRVPSVYDQLKTLDLTRLYHGSQLASEYVHGGLGSGGEVAAIKVERSPFGTFWPQDWSLVVHLCAWSCVLVAQRTDGDSDPSHPVKDLMWAAETLLAALGP